MATKTPWPRKHQQMLRVSDEALARLQRLEVVAGGSKSAAIDLLLRALPLETLEAVIEARLQRDLAGEAAWSRS
jgi:hypothetical protein